MKFISAQTPPLTTARSLEQAVGQTVTLKGAVHRMRRMAHVAFIILRLEDGLVQTVVEDVTLCESVNEGDFVILTGTVKTAKLKDKSLRPHNAELLVTGLTISSQRSTPFSFDITKEDLNLNQNTEFDLRNLTLRHPKRRALFKISETLVNAFESFLTAHHFTRVFSPRIVFAGAEGGANTFSLDYFGKKAFLAQSPQFYKQYGVGIFGRVFDVGTVFRAEKHNTTRHLNEYVSLDIEMGFLESFEELMALETDLLRSMFTAVNKNNSYELQLLGVEAVNVPEKIPAVTLAEAHEIFYKETNQDLRTEPDLTPEEERVLCEWSSKNHQSEFLFITHFPTEKRPFYAKDDPTDPKVTVSFDLLFRGLEITTGGQRVHDYQEQVEKLRRFNLDPEEFESFLNMHKYGMPPHGGFAMGLERITAKLCGSDNVKAASLFPRDMTRITP